MSAPSLAPEEIVARRTRRLQRDERRLARDLARQRAAETLDPLLNEPPPDWLTEEQAGAYAEEVRRLCMRVAPCTRARTACV